MYNKLPQVGEAPSPGAREVDYKWILAVLSWGPGLEHLVPWQGWPQGRSNTSLKITQGLSRNADPYHPGPRVSVNPSLFRCRHSQSALPGIAKINHRHPKAWGDQKEGGCNFIINSHPKPNGQAGKQR